MDGFVKAETIDLNAYRKSTDLIKHTEAYKALYRFMVGQELIAFQLFKLAGHLKPDCSR